MRWGEIIGTWSSDEDGRSRAPPRDDSKRAGDTGGSENGGDQPCGSGAEHTLDDDAEDEYDVFVAHISRELRRMSRNRLSRHERRRSTRN
jgi:hypothetical protein